MRRPLCGLANRAPGGAGAPPGGTTAPCQELADVRADGSLPKGVGLETQAKSAARRRSENAAVERHEGALFVRMRRLALRHPLTLRGGKSLSPRRR
jgi:hypothetical protein